MRDQERMQLELAKEEPVFYFPLRVSSYLSSQTHDQSNIHYLRVCASLKTHSYLVGAFLSTRPL